MARYSNRRRNLGRSDENREERGRSGLAPYSITRASGGRRRDIEATTTVLLGSRRHLERLLDQLVGGPGGLRITSPSRAPRYGFQSSRLQALKDRGQAGGFGFRSYPARFGLDLRRLPIFCTGCANLIQRHCAERLPRSQELLRRRAGFSPVLCGVTIAYCLREARP